MEALRLAEDDGVDAGALVVVGAVVGGAAVVDRAKLILFFNASLSAGSCWINLFAAETEKFYLKETIKTKFQELKTQETNNADPLFVPENIKSLKNRNAIIYSQDVESKFLINTFSSFSNNLLKCFKLDIFNLNYNQFFKEATNINNIFTSLINNFA